MRMTAASWSGVKVRPWLPCLWSRLRAEEPPASAPEAVALGIEGYYEANRIKDLVIEGMSEEQLVVVGEWTAIARVPGRMVARASKAKVAEGRG